MARFKRAYPGPPHIQHGPSPAAAPPAPQLYQARPFVARRRTRARAKTGQGSQTGAGLAAPFAAVTPAPQPTVPVVIGYRRRTRAWTGHCPVAGGIRGQQPVTAPPVTLYRRPVAQIQRPLPARALWHGVPVPAQLPAAVTAYPAPFPICVKRFPYRRAVTGHGTVAGGIASPAVTPPPLSTALGTQRCWITRSRPAARARTGGITATAPPGVTPYLTGVITTHDAGGTVTVWNITGTPAS